MEGVMSAASTPVLTDYALYYMLLSCAPPQLFKLAQTMQ